MKNIHFPFSFLKRAILFFFFAISLTAVAQTPKWNWAKGVGGNSDEGLLGDTKNPVQLDSASNIYELISSASSNGITFGAFSFTNPYSSQYGYLSNYFVKYSPQGTVLWVRQMPQQPAAVGGGPVSPRSFFTDAKGYSTLQLGYRDSLRLGGVFFSDSSITLTHSGTNYAIARYDPNGNVLEIKAHRSTHSGFESIQPFYNNQILGLGITNTSDTLEGQPLVDRGYFFATMDSIGDILKVKSIGYDSATELIVTSGLTVGSKSVYLFIQNLYTPVIHQATIPTGPLDAYLHKNNRMLVKFDSLLNFQWFKIVNDNIYVPMAVDEQDNVFLSAYGNSTLPEDTLVYDTVKVRFPFMLPFDQYSYLGVLKIDGDGKFVWIHTFTSIPNMGATLYRLCTDHLDNIYMAGRTNSLLLVGRDTIFDSGNLFISKLSKDGNYRWTQNTKLAASRSNVYGMAEDGHGNIFINGVFSDPNAHITFGKDSLICHTPVSGKPLAGDVFLASIGNCAPPVPVIMASGPLAWCGGDSVLLSANAATGYLWSSGDSTPAVSAKQSGNYFVYTYDTLGCYAQSKSDTVNAYPQPVINALVQNVRCKGLNDGQISLHTDSATGSVTYNFSPPVSDALNLSAGIYAVMATDEAGCIAIDSVVINEPANNLAVITGGTSSTGNNGTAFASATGGTPPYSFSWGEFQLGDTLTNLTPGWYTVIVSDSNGCTATDSVYVPMITATKNLQQCRFIIYPNPASNNFVIETNATGEQFLQIFDAAGKLVLSQFIKNDKTLINVSDLAMGVYSLRLMSSDGIENRKLVISK